MRGSSVLVIKVQGLLFEVQEMGVRESSNRYRDLLFEVQGRGSLFKVG